MPCSALLKLIATCHSCGNPKAQQGRNRSMLRLENPLLSFQTRHCLFEDATCVSISCITIEHIGDMIIRMFSIGPGGEDHSHMGSRMMLVLDRRQKN